MRIICCDKCGKQVKEEDITNEYLSLSEDGEHTRVEVCCDCSADLDNKRNKACMKVDTDFYANFKYKKRDN